MAEYDLRQLQELLARPREALDIEVKSWLDLSDHNHRADLAKAIIALANHGGGYILLGMKENAAGQFAQTRPDRES
jgi:predicted HTH transcriptional regulator